MLPFEVKDTNHFWRNHTIRKNLDDKKMIRIPVLFKFEDFEDHSVTVFYDDDGEKKERTYSYYQYENDFATWWATFGTWEIRRRWGLNLFDDIPEEEYPKIEEV